MDLNQIAQQITPQAARAFVSAARNVIDAMLIEAERVREVSTSDRIDYETAALPRGTPAGGWLSMEELRTSAQRLAEAIAAEKWTDGFLVAVRLIAALGAIA